MIVDECHHLSAFTSRSMRQVKARYVIGLTATPTRKDGHHPIIVHAVRAGRVHDEGPCNNGIPRPSNTS